VNFSASRFFVSSILAGAMSLGSAYAGQATFHLPMPAHWGNVSMEPGEYRVTVPEVAVGVPVFYLQGESTSAFELVSWYEFAATAERSYMTLVNVDGEYFVKQFVSGADGKIFTFMVPKAKYRQQISQRVVSIDYVGTK